MSVWSLLLNERKTFAAHRSLIIIHLQLLDSFCNLFNLYFLVLRSNQEQNTAHAFCRVL